MIKDGDIYVNEAGDRIKAHVYDKRGHAFISWEDLDLVLRLTYFPYDGEDVCARHELGLYPFGHIEDNYDSVVPKGFRKAE